jgi:hypothetical protein
MRALFCLREVSFDTDSLGHPYGSFINTGIGLVMPSGAAARDRSQKPWCGWRQEMYAIIQKKSWLGTDYVSEPLSCVRHVCCHGAGAW